MNSQEFVLEYFNASNPEHLEAYVYYQRNGEFPEGIFPSDVEITSDLLEALSIHLAEAYIRNFDRIYGKRDEKVAQGIRPNSGNYGFKRDEDGKYKIISAEIKIVRLIYSLYMELESVGKVVQHLNSHAIRTRRGKKWYARSVYNILINPVYIGKIVWRGKISEGAHQPVVSRHIFEKTRKILTANRKR